MDAPRNGHTGQLVVEKPNTSFRVSREVFVSADVLEREQHALFDKCWIYVGHASELRNPGDFKTRFVAGRPIIFVRDRESNARNFYCLYHGWTYQLDGALRNVPGEDAYPSSFDKKSMGLIEAPRLEAYRDFYFLNFD